MYSENDIKAFEALRDAREDAELENSLSDLERLDIELKLTNRVYTLAKSFAKEQDLTLSRLVDKLLLQELHKNDNETAKDFRFDDDSKIMQYV